MASLQGLKVRDLKWIAETSFSLEGALVAASGELSLEIF